MKRLVLFIIFLISIVFSYGQRQVDTNTLIVRDSSDFTNSRLKNVADPTAAQDAVNLQYLQNNAILQGTPIDSLLFSTDIAGLTWQEGKMYFDSIRNNWVLFDSNSEVSLDLGKEQWIDAYNSTVSTITNGQIVFVDTVNGDYPTIELAKADLPTTSDGVIGIATHDIESSTMGRVTTFGIVRDINTSTLTAGLTAYVSATTSGAATDSRPEYPNYAIQIGQVIVSDNDSGQIFVNKIGRIEDILDNGWNGSLLETFNFTISSNGSTITGTLDEVGSTDYLTMNFSDGFTLLSVSTPPTITLTAGTDTDPQLSYVYIPKSTKVLTTSTSFWPSEEYIPIAVVALKSASSTQTDGALRNQNINDHIAGTDGQGHLSHVGARIRKMNAAWESGTEGSVTIGTAAGSPDSVWVAVTGGKVWQMHLQDYPSQDMESGDDIHIVNDFTSPYQTVTNLNSELTDAAGSSLSGRSFSIVVWGVINRTGQTSHLMCNLPTGSYTSSANALADVEGYTVYDIPTIFQGVGFLIARFTFSHSTSGGGTWTLQGTDDLRGKTPNATVGSSGLGGSGITTLLGLTDTPSSYSGFSRGVFRIGSGETSTVFENYGRTITNGQDSIPDEDAVYDFVTGQGYTTISGTDNQVVTIDGTNALQGSPVEIDDSGNMTGVGTLGTSGDITITNTTPDLVLTDSDGGVHYISGNAGDIDIIADNGGAVGSSSIDFQIDGTERAILDASGNLQLDGVIDSDGTGTNTFAGGVQVTDNIETLNSFIITSGVNKWQQLFSGSDYLLRYFTGSSWANKFTLTATGGNATFTGKVTAGADATSGYDLVTYQQIPTLTGIGSGGGLTTNYLTKYNGSTLANSLVFDNGTNVGIGTTDPIEKLHVAGDIYATDSIFADVFANKSDFVLSGSGSKITVNADSLVLTNSGAIGTGVNSAVSGDVVNTFVNTQLGNYLLSGDFNDSISNYLTLTGASTYNVAIGDDVLGNATSPIEAVAIGAGALRSVNTSGGGDEGRYNTGVGFKAGYAITTGNHNTALGWQSLSSNSTGNNNTAIGQDALLSATSTDNTAVGMHNLYLATTGNSGNQANTSVGASGFGSLTTGYWNTSIGAYTGVNPFGDHDAVTTSDRLTLLGTYSGIASGTGQVSRSSAIGFYSLITKSNQIVLGGTANEEVLMWGNVGIDTINPQHTLAVKGEIMSDTMLVVSTLGLGDGGNYVIPADSIVAYGNRNWSSATGLWTDNGGSIYTTDSVFIGASSGSYLFDVQKDASNVFISRINNTNATGGSVLRLTGGADNTDWVILAEQQDGTDLMEFLADGSLTLNTYGTGSTQIGTALYSASFTSGGKMIVSPVPGWTLNSNVIYPTTTTDRVSIGTDVALANTQFRVLANQTAYSTSIMNTNDSGEGLYVEGGLGGNPTALFVEDGGVNTNFEIEGDGSIIAPRLQIGTQDSIVYISSGGEMYIGAVPSTSLTLGTDGQIPYMNAGGDDFEYGSALIWNGTTFGVNSGTTDVGISTTSTDAVASIQFTDNSSSGYWQYQGSTNIFGASSGISVTTGAFSGNVDIDGSSLTLGTTASSMQLYAAASGNGKRWLLQGVSNQFTIDGIDTGDGQDNIATAAYVDASNLIWYWNNNIISETTANYAASATQSQGQTPMFASICIITTVSTTNDAVTMPSAVEGMVVRVINNGANTVQIFPASGDDFNGGTTNASITQAAGTNVTYVAIDGTQWEAM